MNAEDQVKFIREAQIENERAKLKTAQGKRIIPVLLSLKNDLSDITAVMKDAQENPAGDLATVKLDAAGVTKTLDSATEALTKLNIEMKAQRITDTHGAIGWRAVREYEVPDLADDEDDAKAMRAALSRAEKKMPRKTGGYHRRSYTNAYGARREGYGGYQGASYAQPPPPGVFAPMGPPPAQFMRPAAAQGTPPRGGGMGPSRPRACYRCGQVGHLQDSCPNGPPRM